MTTLRLREQAQQPATVQQHATSPDHLLRLQTTLSAAQWLAGGRMRRAADLSAGDGWLLRRIDAGDRYFGDAAATTGGWFRGPIETTVDYIPKVDLFLLCETLEHLDDPAGALDAIRPKTERLVLSTPLEAWQDDNPEHLWAWDRTGVESLLADAGFMLQARLVSDARPSSRLSYKFGIWLCR